MYELEQLVDSSQVQNAPSQFDNNGLISCLSYKHRSKLRTDQSAADDSDAELPHQD